MGISIQSAVPTASLLRTYNQINRSYDRTLQRLASGHRVNTAGDDPAGLGVATNLSARGASAAQAGRNINDGISLLQIADSGTQEVQEILKRLRELAVQGSTGTISSSDRTALQTENDELALEITRISANVEYNDIQLMDGSSPSLKVQVGIHANAYNQVKVTLGSSSASTLGVDALSLSSTSDASSAITAIDEALDTVAGYRANYGASENRLDSSLNYALSYEANMSQAVSNIMDVDYAAELARKSILEIQQTAAISVISSQLRLRANLLDLL